MDSRAELVQETLRGQPKKAYSTKNQRRKTLLFFCFAGRTVSRRATGELSLARWCNLSCYVGRRLAAHCATLASPPAGAHALEVLCAVAGDRCVKVEHAGTMRRRGPCLENTNHVQLSAAPSEHAAHRVNILRPCLLQATRPANASTDAVSPADTGS